MIECVCVHIYTHELCQEIIHVTTKTKERRLKNNQRARVQYFHSR